jgi:hypothetical protein
MSVKTFVEKLKDKPEHIRKQYAFWSSLGLTAVVFVFWLASFGSVGVTTKANVSKAVSKVGTPAQSMIAGVGSFFEDLSNMIFGPKKIKYSTLEVRPGTK